MQDIQNRESTKMYKRVHEHAWVHDDKIFTLDRKKKIIRKSLQLQKGLRIPGVVEKHPIIFQVSANDTHQGTLGLCNPSSSIEQYHPYS